MLMNDVDTVEFIKTKFLEIRANSQNAKQDKYKRNLEITIEYYTLLDDTHIGPRGLWDAKAIHKIMLKHNLSYDRVIQCICRVLRQFRFITHKYGIIQ